MAVFKRKSSLLKRSTSEIIVLCFWFVLFCVFSIMYAYPIFWAFINSFKTGREFFDSPMALPTVWKFANYGRVFTDFRWKEYGYLDMVINSLWITGVKVFVNVLSSVLLAYPVAKFRFPGRGLLYGAVIFANTIPIFGTGTTAYKLALGLGMVDNPFLIWLMWAGGFDFAFIVFYGTFKGISNSYSESAAIDGASDLRVLLQIVLPQAFPAIVAIAVTQAIPVWNDYGTSMIYLRSFPNLAYGLFVFQKESNYIQDSKAIYFCAVIISMIPPAVLYGSCQKLLLTNITAGGLKG